MNYENKKLSRKRKRRTEGKNKMDDKRKILLNKNKAERKKKKKNIDKIKELEIKMVKIKYANNPTKIQSELKDINKIHVVNKNLHQIKNEILLDYTGEFEMVANLKIGHQIRETHIRFRNSNNYESYINAIDQHYESDDAISNGYNYKKQHFSIQLR